MPLGAALKTIPRSVGESGPKVTCSVMKKMKRRRWKKKLGDVRAAWKLVPPKAKIVAADL